MRLFNVNYSSLDRLENNKRLASRVVNETTFRKFMVILPSCMCVTCSKVLKNRNE